MSTESINVSDLQNMSAPDDLKGLVKDVLDANSNDHFSMMLPVIGVTMLIQRISKLEQQVLEQQSDLDEEDRLRTRLAQLLTQTANALHEGPLENGSWSWHDLPILAANAMDKIRRLEKANENLSFNR